MNHNLNKPQNSNRPYMLEFQVRDGGGAQEEPYVGIQSAHAQSGNPWTGCGPMGLATSAQVNKTPRHISSEAEDAESPGRGSCKSYTDPFRSLTLRGEEPPKDHSMINMSDDKSSMPSTDEDKHTEPMERTHQRCNPNTPRKRPCIKVTLLNIRENALNQSNVRQLYP